MKTLHDDKKKTKRIESKNYQAKKKKQFFKKSTDGSKVVHCALEASNLFPMNFWLKSFEPIQLLSRQEISKDFGPK